jgi:sirohydrochlorin cobaltochelatase
MLILMAHGSPNPAWRASVEQLTATLQRDVGELDVRLAYMECAPPTLQDVVADALESGVAEFRVLPLFLASQGHVERNVVPLVDEVRETYSSAEIVLLPALGEFRQFREFLAAVAQKRAD